MGQEACKEGGAEGEPPRPARHPVVPPVCQRRAQGLTGASGSSSWRLSWVHPGR